MKYYTIYAWGECPFCVKAKAFLIEKRQAIQYVVLDHASDLLKNYKSIYNMKTVPIIVFKDEDSNIEKVIGGYTDLVEHFAKRSREDSRTDD